MSREFTQGEKYRPVVSVEKVKKGKPTAINIGGRRYIYDPGTVGRFTKRKNKRRNR